MKNPGDSYTITFATPALQSVLIEIRHELSTFISKVGEGKTRGIVPTEETRRYYGEYKLDSDWKNKLRKVRKVLPTLIGKLQTCHDAIEEVEDTSCAVGS